ncbi:MULTISPECIES: RNA polymerase sigma factor [unclassified Streptomyces]|uniref:RNA polymerase sigma factor n=1 Tax=unclassified Streptomyces TaxID=2593676 RepID=UPI002DDBDBBB|nr:MULTISPECIES: RNA polymerase sigma factor [unclassified Streptomyces]WSA92823.1 RNA polymerase sigma factor [Streptomyces sp. NBC_01795]WSB77193.1 RNA polymerase sigma factor [Streptomyces sp. NBC_01775]WSS14543.1 RNA polymerase sigma factor [Streptomyces sp. NBC_01186]WSS43361.1 RNA polymerase sigma factor [Streptomyces sp. NBC_01187]
MTDSTHSRLREGDPAALAEAFREHADAVYRHALWSTGNWATAEDIVSLTYLEAWCSRERLRPEETGSLRPWLLGIATNVLRNTARSARRHRKALARMPRSDIVPNFADEVAGRLADAEQLAAAMAALEGLRRAEREVFTLCVWGGLDYASAAEALGIPVGTVRSRLSRARAKLRDSVGHPATRRDDTQRAPGRELPGGSGQIQRVDRIPARTTQENPA